MSNNRFNILAPNKLSKDNNKDDDKVIKKDTNAKKEVKFEDKKLNMFKKKPQNTRFNFNHENNDDRNEERDRTNSFQYNKNNDDRNEERDTTNTFQYNKNNDNSFRKKRRDNHRRESYFDRRKYIKEKEAKKKAEEEAKKFKYKDDDFPSL